MSLTDGFPLLGARLWYEKSWLPSFFIVEKKRNTLIINCHQVKVLLAGFGCKIMLRECNNTAT